MTVGDSYRKRGDDWGTLRRQFDCLKDNKTREYTGRKREVKFIEEA